MRPTPVTRAHRLLKKSFLMAATGVCLLLTGMPPAPAQLRSVEAPSTNPDRSGHHLQYDPRVWRNGRHVLY